MSGFESRVYAAGEACMQGRRPTMEDAHTVITDATKEAGLADGSPSMSVFTIFDGHAGSTCANIASTELWKKIVSMPEISKTNSSDSKTTTEAEKKAVSSDIITCVEEYDAKLIERCRKENISDGCTMAGILVRDNDVFCFNAGDSRSVIGQWVPNKETENAETEETKDKSDIDTNASPTTESESMTQKAPKEKSNITVMSKALSEDHKPTIPREYKRITSVGGRVSPTRMRLGGLGGLGGLAAAIGGAACGIPVEIPLGPDRVWPGGLALSRALGDLPFKDLSGELPKKEEDKEEEEKLKEKEIKEMIESKGDTDGEIGLSSLKRFGITHQLVVPTPDITCVTLSDSDVDKEKAKKDLDSFLLSCSFLIVACDGLWDVMTSSEAAEYVATQIHDEIENIIMAEKQTDISAIDLSPICEKVSQNLVQEAYFKNSQDNISAIVVILKGKLQVEDAPEEQENVEAEQKETVKNVELKEENASNEEEEKKEESKQEEPKGSGDRFGQTISLYKYFNPKDPSEAAMLPETPVPASPIEDDPESWGIIALPYGMGLM